MKNGLFCSGVFVSPDATTGLNVETCSEMYSIAVSEILFMFVFIFANANQDESHQNLSLQNVTSDAVLLQ